MFRYGCGGLFVLVITIATLGGGGEETATEAQSGDSGQSGQNQTGSQDQNQSGDQGSDPAAAEEEQPVAGIGEPVVQVGEVRWTVTGTESTNQLTSELQESKQGNFVIVNFTFTNNGTEAKTLDSASMTLVDNQGRKSEADTDSSMYLDPSQDIFLEQVNPGVTKEGTVIYTVAPDASDFQLEVGDTNLFSGESARIDLNS